MKHYTMHDGVNMHAHKSLTYVSFLCTVSPAMKHYTMHDGVNMHAHKLAGTAACGVAFTVSDICIILMHSVTCHESTDVHDSHVTYTMHDGTPTL